MEKVSTEGPDLLDHYATDASRRGSLWIPEIDCNRVETTIPRLLHIPLVLFVVILREKGGPLMPHEILAIVLKLVENSSRDQDQAAAAEAWKLVVMWCVMAVQADKQGDSIVAFAVEAATENGDAYFGQWIENCLDGTMGKRPAVDSGMGATRVATPAQGPAQFAAELGKGVAMGLHALGPFKPPSVTQGGGVDSDSKQ
jgi:hypothetical protein